MNSFYTNVQVYGSRILYRGVENGRKVKHKIDYYPTLYVPSSKPTKFTTVTGEYMSEMKPGNIRDCRDFVKQYDSVENFKIYGNQRYEYAFIGDQHNGEVEWDREHINICNIDIEVGSENGFPDPILANEAIISITYKMNNKFIVFGCGDFINKRVDVHYVKCYNELDLIKRFIDEFTGNYPDIITGWYVKFFDVPYLVNRITKLMGQDFAKRLSPWNILNERMINIMGKDQQVWLPLGIALLDYLDLYQKFAPEGKSKETYKLGFICNEELNETKLSYEEYGDLHTLYKDNYQLFIEYNIRDVELVDKLDDKLKLLDLALTLAYDSKTNYEDVFSQVRMWDALIYNELKSQNKVVPPTERHSKDDAYIGAYVKDPLVGKHNWVASFDLNSLYPHLIMQYNVSPDKLIEPTEYTDDMQNFIASNIINVDTLLNQSVDTSGLKSFGATLTPNGQLFRTDKQGFLAKMMEDMYNDRSKYKKKAIQAKKELEKETDSTKRFEIQKRISRYNNLQLAKKVSLNSAYGALGNQYFRFFDVRQASAITTAGQLSIRWIEMRLNGYLNKLLGTQNKDYVIASDTDSIYLCLDELINKTIKEKNRDHSTRSIISFMDKICEAKIQPFIDKSYNDLAEYLNVMSQKMIMKREALADTAIWTAKKRYVLNVYNNEGVEYTKPVVKVMGLEMIKSSTPSIVRTKLGESIDVILNKTETDMIDFIEQFRKEFRTCKPSEIAFPRGVNGIEKYAKADKSVPIHVRGSLVYNSLLSKYKLTTKYPTIKEGEKIKYIYLKEPNTIRSNVIAFPQVLPDEFDLLKYVDFDLQFDKTYLEPLKIILNSIGWKAEKSSSLESFFS